MQDIRVKVEGNEEDIKEFENRLKEKGIQLKSILELSAEEQLFNLVKWAIEHPSETIIIARVFYNCLKGLKVKISGLYTKEKTEIDSNDSEEEIDSKLKEINQQREEFNEAVRKKSEEYTKS